MHELWLDIKDREDVSADVLDGMADSLVASCLRLLVCFLKIRCVTKGLLYKLWLPFESNSIRRLILFLLDFIFVGYDDLCLSNRPN